MIDTSNKLVLLQPPCLMEDEGFTHVIAVCDTYEEVAQAARDYTDNDTGYFRVSNLVWVGDVMGDARLSEDLKPFMPKNLRERR